MNQIFRTLTLGFCSAFCAMSVANATPPQTTVPKTNVSFWNKANIVGENNCYNYSTNRETDSFAQPGEASKKEYQGINCTDVIAAASADLGLTPTAFFPYATEKDMTLIALVVAPDLDFHWYRRDSSGLWTHKPGSSPATNVDEDGNEITSPETANRGFYTDFCGYFKIDDYPKSTTEQNGGYVRIGNMTDLPKLPTVVVQSATPTSSDVEVLMYSGRRNPHVPLQQMLKNEELKTLLKKASAGIHTLARSEKLTAAVRAEWEHPHLGYQGVIVRDHEGLVFPKESVVYFGGSSGYVMMDKNQTYFMPDENAPAIRSALQYFVAGLSL